MKLDNLAALSIIIGDVRRRLQETDGEIPQKLEIALTIIEEVDATTRDLTLDLRPPILDDYGILATLKWYTGRLRERTGFEVEVVGDELDKRLNAEEEVGLFRIAQEALANAMKHSRASKATVEFGRTEAGILKMSIADDGIGFDAKAKSSSGTGLPSMRERARSIGAELQIISEPENGTRISVSVPS